MTHSGGWHNILKAWAICVWVRWQYNIKNFAVEIKLLDNLLPLVSRCKSHKVYGTMAMGISLFASTWFKASLAMCQYEAHFFFVFSMCFFFYCCVLMTVDEFNWMTPTITLLNSDSFFFTFKTKKSTNFEIII